MWGEWKQKSVSIHPTHGFQSPHRSENLVKKVVIIRCQGNMKDIKKLMLFIKGNFYLQ